MTGVLFLPNQSTGQESLLLASELLPLLPVGVALLTDTFEVVWANDEFSRLVNEPNPTSRSFYDLLGIDEPPAPVDCPLSLTLTESETIRDTLRIHDDRYFEIDSRAIRECRSSDDPTLLFVTVRDVSERETNRHKFDAIAQAGLDLGDLSPQDISGMSQQERVELLKSKILYYTSDILKYETVEIRLLDSQTGKLNQLLQVGMQPLAADRELYASSQGNGVTGFVAETGRSYLCPDIDHDPLYLPGAQGAKSSLTVPLILHDQVLGTFNVEAHETGAFDERDLQFLELFSREIAAALNTLNLLQAERQSTAVEGTQLILRKVANPVDEILIDATWILEKLYGQDEELTKRVQRLLKDARQIRQLIHQAGATIAPEEPNEALVTQTDSRPTLLGRRILVADQDEETLQSAHELLERYGCVVETAHNAEESFLMARSFDYDLVITDIRLPDRTGYECYRQLKTIDENLPVLLMTGFGYDSSHSIVKARQEGLQGVVYKPFRLDMLLDEVEKAVPPVTNS
ncbi:MAG: response regulator [Planctomycetaceae bacterium]|nr:response regulator [Planctomycetaceae bacterium]